MDIELSTLDFIKLSQGYYRRLMNTNQEIRQLRKEKKCVKALNEKRKRINQCYNLLMSVKPLPLGGGCKLRYII